MLQCNVISHWLSPYPEWSLIHWNVIQICSTESRLHDKSALVQVKACHRTDDKPLPEVIMTKFSDAYSVRFLRRPVGPRPATLMSGLQLQKRVGPVGRQLLYLICWAEWSTNVNGYWRNKILFKRYTFIYDPNQHYPEMCTLITRGIEIVSASSIKEIKVLP